MDDSLDFEISEDNEGFEVVRAEDYPDSERGDEENNEIVEIEREEDDNIALLNIDLNMSAPHEFDLNEFPDEEDEVFQERVVLDQEAEIKEEMKKIIKIWVSRF